MDIIIEAEPKTEIAVSLVGEEYTVVPPKASFAIKIAVRSKQSENTRDPDFAMSSIYEWIDAAFGKEVGQRIRERLDDSDDQLDIDHIATLMQKIMEFASGNPTG